MPEFSVLITSRAIEYCIIMLMDCRAGKRLDFGPVWLLERTLSRVESFVIHLVLVRYTR